MASESSASNPTLAAWHAIAAARDVCGLRALIAEDCVFHSPVVYTPQVGRARVIAYLSAAIALLGNDTFCYVRQIVGTRDAALEFRVTVDELDINGVDLIRWNEEGRIVEFKVLIRPLKALEFVQRRMMALLAAGAGGSAPQS